jgi:hypothetical protein
MQALRRARVSSSVTERSYDFARAELIEIVCCVSHVAFPSKNLTLPSGNRRLGGQVEHLAAALKSSLECRSPSVNPGANATVRG